MAKKEFQLKRGDKEVNISIEYRMPTKREWLSIGGILSFLVGAVLLFTAANSEDE
jgi:hypothetical protein